MAFSWRLISLALFAVPLTMSRTCGIAEGEEDGFIQVRFRRPALEASASNFSDADTARRLKAMRLMQDAWTLPERTFQHCVALRQSNIPRRTGFLQSHVETSFCWESLPPLPKCEEGELLIGEFNSTSTGLDYIFQCCAGKQCGGCRKMRNGLCEEFAAGFKKQQIPFTNQSQCFICDDLTGWRNAEGQSCSNVEKLGICNGHWPEPAPAFHGIHASEACCACGGGSLSPSPVFMPLTAMMPYELQFINATPQPMVAQRVEVSENCNLFDLGLSVNRTTGSISGAVKENSTSASCSILTVQDLVRGVFSTQEINLVIEKFSYGESVVMFRRSLNNFMGQKAEDEVKDVRTKANLKNFELECLPECPWLEMATNGSLTAHNEEVHELLRGGVQDFPKQVACRCQVSALENTTLRSIDFTVLQVRLWLAAEYNLAKAGFSDTIDAQIGMEIPSVELREKVDHDLKWVERDDMDYPVIQDSKGQEWIVPAAAPPTILDVKCDSDKGELSWSRLSGDVRLEGQLAFNLNPETGEIGGTPRLDMQQNEGRSLLEVTCHLALGGRPYDRVLPLAVVRVRIYADTCWVQKPMEPKLWEQVGTMSRSQCLALCRQRSDCGVAYHPDMDAGPCFLQTSNATKGEVTTKSPAFVRIGNCKEDTSCMILEAPHAHFVTGEYCPEHTYKTSSTFSRAGSVPQRQLLLAKTAFGHNMPCNSTWTLMHINSSDFTDATSAKPEFYGRAIACVGADDVVEKTFRNGTASFSLQFLPAGMPDTSPYVVSSVQKASLQIASATCSKPDTEKGLVYGNVVSPEFFHLKECECFGEARKWG